MCLRTLVLVFCVCVLHVEGVQHRRGGHHETKVSQNQPEENSERSRPPQRPLTTQDSYTPPLTTVSTPIEYAQNRRNFAPLDTVQEEEQDTLYDDYEIDATDMSQTMSQGTELTDLCEYLRRNGARIKSNQSSSDKSEITSTINTQENITEAYNPPWVISQTQNFHQSWNITQYAPDSGDNQATEPRKKMFVTSEFSFISKSTVTTEEGYPLPQDTVQGNLPSLSHPEGRTRQKRSSIAGQLVPYIGYPQYSPFPQYRQNSENENNPYYPNYPQTPEYGEHPQNIPQQYQESQHHEIHYTLYHTSQLNYNQPPPPVRSFGRIPISSWNYHASQTHYFVRKPTEEPSRPPFPRGRQPPRTPPATVSSPGTTESHFPRNNSGNGLSLSGEACKRYQMQAKKYDTGNGVSDRIGNGEDAEEGDFPYMVAIGYVVRETDDVSWQCGGSLISERFVLTAAHCITDADCVENPRELLVVRAGSVRLRPSPVQATDLRVQAVHLHPEWPGRPVLSQPAYHDLALLRLHRDVTPSLTTRPVCLPAPGSEPPGVGDRLFAAGWGHTGTQEAFNGNLQKAQFSVLSARQCEPRIRGRDILLPRGLNNLLLCVRDSVSIFCKGDSGGPLVARGVAEGVDILVGVHSLSGTRCEGNNLALAAHTQPALPWIESIVWTTKAFKERTKLSFV